MPDLKISELPPASAPAGGELTPVVQAGQTRRATISQITRAAFAERSVHVRDFGAVGDGVANDAPAIQAAINALRGPNGNGGGGGVVQFGPRNYRIATAIAVNGVSVRLQGVGFSEGAAPGEGTWFTADNPAITPFTFTGTAARGSAVRDIAVREIHLPGGPGWAPTNYGFFFRVEDCFGAIDFDNVLLASVNRGIFCRNSGRLDIRRLRGQVFTTGLELDEMFDVPRIQSLHFWPFWSASDHVVRWQQQNGDAMVFRRCDGVFVDQSFVLGYRSMFRFASSPAGVTSKFNIGQSYADFVRHGIWVEADDVDGQVDAMTVQCELFNAAGAPLPGSVGVLLGGARSRIQVGSLRIDDAEDNAIRLVGAGNRLDLFALRCVNFNLRNNGSSAIHLANAPVGHEQRVHLGSPALLEGTTAGPLANGGTNAVVQVAGAGGGGGVSFPVPAGSAAAPSVSVGAANTGLFQPAANQLGIAANGAEVMRATQGGPTTVGGAQGAHPLEVAGGAGANRIVVAGAATGAPPSVTANGADATIDLVLGARGNTGAVVLRSGTLTVARAVAASTTPAALLIRGDNNLVSLLPDAGTNVPFALASRGASELRLQTNAGVTQAQVVHVGGAVNTMQLQGGATGTPGRVGWLAAGVDANIAAVIGQPKGTGPLLAQFPDNGVAGGGARGANAVDLQTSRWAAVHVASGALSVIGGGFANLASGVNSTISGGDGNQATATRGTVAGGGLNQATGVASWVPGGLDATVRGHHGRGAWSGGTFATNGDAQAGEFVLRGATTGAAALRLTADAGPPGAGNTLNLPDQGAYAVRLIVVARQSAGSAGAVGDSATWEVTALVRRGVGVATTVLVGSTGGGTPAAPAFSDAAAAVWRVQLAPDTAQGGLAVTVTGEANKTIRWVARAMSAEVQG